MAPSGRGAPKAWPTNLQFLTAPCFHSSVSSTIQSFIQHGAPQDQPHASKAPRSCSIRSISASSHPALGQHGLFAFSKIPPRMHIIDYIGEVHCDDRPHSDYDLSLYRFQDGISVGVDASEMGNEARFINDYRGVRSKPNAEFRDRRTGEGELRMSVWSLTEPIKKGDEIVVSYGKAWWQARDSSESIASG